MFSSFFLFICKKEAWAVGWGRGTLPLSRSLTNCYSREVSTVNDLCSQSFMCYLSRRWFTAEYELKLMHFGKYPEQSPRSLTWPFFKSLSSQRLQGPGRQVGKELKWSAGGSEWQVWSCMRCCPVQHSGGINSVCTSVHGSSPECCWFHVW